MHPWSLKIDQISFPTDSISQILHKLLSMNHPNGSIENILTFMWCIWKSRNDCLFNKKETSPSQFTIWLMLSNKTWSCWMLCSFQQTGPKQSRICNRKLQDKETQSRQILPFKATIFFRCSMKDKKSTR
jgi:hypothetical protein